MGHIVAIMMLLAGMLMFSGGPVLAAPAALESLSAQVSDARSFELEPLDPEDASNIVPFKRAM